jgi:hypothetical protein
MKVFIYETQSDLPLFFQRVETHIPFLHTNLLSFLGAGFVRSAIQQDEEVQIFLPHSWEGDIHQPHNYSFYNGELSKTLLTHQKREYELVFITSLFSLLVGDFYPHDVTHLKQNPENLFSNNGIVGGYLKRGQEMPKPEVFSGFSNVTILDFDNFLRLNQSLIGNLNIKSVDTLNIQVYGKPTILSESISGDTTICYPSFIDKGVVVRNSYIGPGTVLRGNTSVEDSKLYGSFIDASKVVSSELHDSIISSAYIQNSKLGRNTLVPPGSMIYSER